MRRLTASITLVCAFATLAFAQSGLPLIQPDAGIVFGVDWRRILDSKVGAQIAEQIRKNDLPKIPGLDSMQETLLNDIDSILVAAPSNALNKGANQSAGLVVVKGRFDASRLRTLFARNATPEPYRAVELFSSPKNVPATNPAARNSLFGVLDANTMLLGDRIQVHAAIDRLKTGRLVQSRSGILAGITELAANNDVWIVAAIPPGASKDAPAPMQQMMADMRSAEIGASFRDGLALHVNVRTKDAPSAGQVLQTLQGLIGVAALSQSQNPQAADMLRKLQLSSNGSQVKLALSLDQSELDKMIKEAQAARANPPAAPRSPTAINGIRPPAPPPPGTVRITGLDGGPVEVPMTQPRK